jgi:heat shock protein HspQ
LIKLFNSFVDPPKSSGFKPGDLIHHKRYEYRGVIVDFDLTCTADENWYQNNQTQPKQNQPWYHVLVHNTEMVTYVAQSNLERDDSGDEIIHPMLSVFFNGFRNGRYDRNEKQWF